MAKLVCINFSHVRLMLRNKSVVNCNIVRCITSKGPGKSADEPPLKDELLHSYLESLQCKGFLRSHKTYDPPSDVTKQIKLVCAKIMTDKDLRTDFANEELKNPVQRFKILTNCMKIFNHEITNSQLHKMITIGDVISYFNTPVRGTTSYDDLHASDDLPPNLHVALHPLRFHPETDTMFGGISAYPGRSTIVTGLKYKKKYKGFKATTPWEKAPKV